MKRTTIFTNSYRSQPTLISSSLSSLSLSNHPNIQDDTVTEIGDTSTYGTCQQEQSISSNYYKYPINRRTVLSTLFIPMISSATTTSFNNNNNKDDELTNIQLGTGQWQHSSKKTNSIKSQPLLLESSTTTSSSIYTATFCTYAARFLIYYDPSIHDWWTQLVTRNQQLYNNNNNNNNNIDQFNHILYHNFASFAKSLEITFKKSLEITFDKDKNLSSSMLYEHFVQNYYYNNNVNNNDSKNKDEILRQINILFTLLPPNQQPIQQLEMFYNNYQNNGTNEKVIMSNTKVIENNNDNNTIQLPWQRLDRIELLPNTYMIQRIQQNKINDNTNNKNNDDDTSYAFTIQPSIPFYEHDIINNNNNSDNSRSDISSSSINSVLTVFGPIASKPLIRDIPHYSFQTYMTLGIAGATSCALTHMVVIPLDVVKTRAQTNPYNNEHENKANNNVNNNNNIEGGTIASVSHSNANVGILQSSINMIQRDGFESLLLGAQATIVGYFWYGFSVYPSYTFCKRYISNDIFSPTFTILHGNEIALFAGACAAVIASLGLTPIEAARIRVVADPITYRSLGLIGTLNVIATENSKLGVMNLYASLPSLLIRQVIFGSTKFLVFERVCEYIYMMKPEFNDSTWTCLAVTLFAGGFSGVISSVVSQPADSILTFIAKDKLSTDKSINIVDILNRMVKENGILSLFRGLRSRCLWAGSIIAGQFFLYDIFRTWFGVSSQDLTQYYEIVLPDISTIVS